MTKKNPICSHCGHTISYHFAVDGKCAYPGSWWRILGGLCHCEKFEL